jgi:uncharacterized protein
MMGITMHTLTLLLLTALLSGCTHLFFHPHRILVDTPDQFNLEYQVEKIKTADGILLNAWFLSAQNNPAKNNLILPKIKPEAKATVLFLHGNAENISTHFRSIAWLSREGFNVLALDYRGYGESEGVPTLAGMQLDIDAAMRSLLVHQDVNPNKMIVFGQSLGGALAIHYTAHSAYRAHIRAVVIDSAFYDYRQIAREKLATSPLTWLIQWLPWLIINNDYSPADSIAAISPLPLLLLHGDRDVVVPLHHSQQLFEHAKEPKEHWIEQGVGHTQAMSRPALRKILVEFLLRHSG